MLQIRSSQSKRLGKFQQRVGRFRQARNHPNQKSRNSAIAPPQTNVRFRISPHSRVITQSLQILRLLSTKLHILQIEPFQLFHTRPCILREPVDVDLPVPSRVVASVNADTVQSKHDPNSFRGSLRRAKHWISGGGLANRYFSQLPEAMPFINRQVRCVC